MKATELLKQQHRDVTKLFKAFADERSDAKKRQALATSSATPRRLSGMSAAICALSSSVSLPQVMSV